MARIQISIDDELLEKVDNYTKKRYISRSGLISFLLNQHLMTYDLVEQLRVTNSKLSQIKNFKELDDEELKERIDELDLILSMMNDIGNLK